MASTSNISKTQRIIDAVKALWDADDDDALEEVKKISAEDDSA